MPPSSFTKRCICGALMVSIAAGGAAMHHDLHTHQDSPSRPPAPTRTVFLSSTTTTSTTAPIFGDFFRSRGT